MTGIERLEAWILTSAAWLLAGGAAVLAAAVLGSWWQALPLSALLFTDLMLITWCWSLHSAARWRRGLVRWHASRPLTPGEVDMLTSVFGRALPYDRIRIHACKACFLQPGDTAMAPDGHVYFPPAHHREDFSTAPLADRAWLVHEAAHLYQYHALGWNVKLRGLLDRRYGYRLTPGRRLQDYGLEQQGAIAQDYYTLRHGGHSRRPYRLADYDTLFPPVAAPSA